MSLWQKTFNSELVKWPDKYFNNTYHDLEILNNTSINFIRPETPDNSQIDAKIASEKKIRDLLLCIRPETIDNSQTDAKITSEEKIRDLILCINTNAHSSSLHVKPSSQDRSVDVYNDVKKSLFDPPKCSSEKTKRSSIQKVKFAIDPDHHRSKKTEEKIDDIIIDGNDNENIESLKSFTKNSKAYRRASAPAHGMPFVYFSNSEITSIHYFGQRSPKEHELDNQNSKISTDNAKQHESISGNTSPTLSTPCSSLSSSCSSPIFSPAQSTQMQQHLSDKKSLQAFNQPFQPGTFLSQPVTTPITMRSRSKSVSTENPIPINNGSLPNIVTAESYQNLPWSPAVNFLANLAQSTVSKPMPYDEGQQIGDYIIGKVIGRGGFSTVKEAIKMNNDYDIEKYAVKIVRKNQKSDCDDRIQELLDREISIWRELVHPNIVQMITREEDEYATYVFSEYCSGGTLLNYIKKNCRSENKGLNEDDARNIFLEIAEGLRYLHNDVRLVHKDIKLDNILLDKEGTWKIGDFGLTEFQNDENGFGDLSDEEAGGSLAYCAPEQARSKTSIKNPTVDIWSLGVVLYALVTNKLPFMDDFVPRLQYKIINGRYDESALYESGCSDDLRDLLKKIFKTNPTQRLTINGVLEHRWCQR
ncbi:25684_t:CDS:2 [Gigaspora rosea]|nr:25684_t:CDS:2 [Gigaspora rosea]